MGLVSGLEIGFADLVLIYELLRACRVLFSAAALFLQSLYTHRSLMFGSGPSVLRVM
jgi:hypothetical protein